LPGYDSTFKAHGIAVNQGGTTDKLFIRPWQKTSVKGFSFVRRKEVYYVVNKTMA
jgi:hypothetical protein